MKLSGNFSLSEFTRSETAAALGLSNEPSAVHRANLARLAAVLEEVRALVGVPIVITSGYRSPAVNRAVGGVPDSAHALGHAADIRVERLGAYSLARLIQASGIRFDQLILETSRAIVHISTDPRGRRQCLTQRRGAGTPFESGIVP